MSTGSRAKYKFLPDVNRSSHYQRGFSLLEILVAFSILAMSLGVLYQIFSQGSHTAILTEEYTKATIIAESRLAATGDNPTSLTQIQRGTELNKYHWETSMTPYTESSPSAYQKGASLYEANVKVSWGGFGKKRVIELQSLKLLPDE